MTWSSCNLKPIDFDNQQKFEPPKTEIMQHNVSAEVLYSFLEVTNTAQRSSCTYMKSLNL